MAVKRKTAKKKAPAKRKAPAKKTAAKKTAAKKAPAKRKAPAKKAAAKRPVSDVVTLKHLAADIAEAYEIPKKQSEEMLSEFVDMIGANLKKGKKLRIPGLGILQVRKRAARMGRNPATGETIRIKASKKVAFRVAKDLKERVL
ncbi:MAG: HU family DNA-binding protein [Pseudomonadota bacterium]